MSASRREKSPFKNLSETSFFSSFFEETLSSLKPPPQPKKNQRFPPPLFFLSSLSRSRVHLHKKEQQQLEQKPDQRKNFDLGQMMLDYLT